MRQHTVLLPWYVRSRAKNKLSLERNWASTVSIPYAPSISETIRRALNQEGIRVACTSTGLLGKSLIHVKDSMPKHNAGHLVYKLSCQDSIYIGEPPDQWPTERRNIRG